MGSRVKSTTREPPAWLTIRNHRSRTSPRQLYDSPAVRKTSHREHFGRSHQEILGEGSKLPLYFPIGDSMDVLVSDRLLEDIVSGSKHESRSVSFYKRSINASSHALMGTIGPTLVCSLRAQVGGGDRRSSSVILPQPESCGASKVNCKEMFRLDF
jgi:hypothetical protein